jgi:peptide chain release factor 1
MFSRLDKVEVQYDSLSEKLSDPAVAQDQNLFRKLAKEHSDLKEVVETYRRYKKVCSSLEENKELLSTEKDDELCQMIKEDITSLENEIKTLTDQIKVLLIPKDPNDNKNVIMEIRAGTGGDEAALFAADLFRMYQRFAEEKKWKIEITDENRNDLGGIKELIAIISGENVYSQLKFESGVHRVQRVPKTETQGRVHTSAISVSILPEADDIEVEINESELRFEAFRSSGPGGQGVNTTDSAVRITHESSGIVVVCRDERSQIKNKAKAMKILKARLYEKKLQEQNSEIRSTRRSHVGSGDRSEKIRTYNFPQNRVSDHRIGLTLHNLDLVLEGRLAELISALNTYYQAEALKGNQPE